MPFAARILGTGSAFPNNRVSNDQLARKLAELKVETSDRWIRERTGIRERRYADVADSAECNSSLGAAAALRALEMAGKRPEDLDQIVVATCSPDTMMPSTACWLQEKIGAVNAWAMDVNAACSGFIYGTVVAGQFIGTGAIRTALVVGSEVMHPFLNWHDRASCILFGDGAGAAVIESVPDNSSSRIISWQLRSNGKFCDLLYIPAASTIAGGSDGTSSDQFGKIVMNGREIFKVAVRRLSEIAQLILAENQLTIDDVDWFIPHQANFRIIEAVAQRLGLPAEKVLFNVDRYGNTSAATIPTVLDEAVRQGRIRTGHLLLLDTFGAGFTFGAMLIRW